MKKLFCYCSTSSCFQVPSPFPCGTESEILRWNASNNHFSPKGWIEKKRGGPLHRRSNIIIVLICMQRRKGNEEERPIRVGRCQGGMAAARPCGRTQPSDGYASPPLIDVAKTNIFRSQRNRMFPSHFWVKRLRTVGHLVEKHLLILEFRYQRMQTNRTRILKNP